MMIINVRIAFLPMSYKRIEKRKRGKRRIWNEGTIICANCEVADIEVLLSYRKTGKLQHLLALSIMSIIFMRLWIKY